VEGSYQKLEEGLKDAMVLISQSSVEHGCVKGSHFLQTFKAWFKQLLSE